MPPRSPHGCAPRRLGILRTGEAFFQSRGLGLGEAAVGFRALANQCFWIEVAGFGVKDHAILDAVESVALIEQTFDHRFLVAVGKSILGKRLTFLILRRNLV